MISRSLLTLVSFVFITACQDYKTVAVKDFRIYADTDSPAIKHSIEVMVAHYNRDFGSTALTLVDKPENSNSRIRFTPGLHEDGQKLGLGQWITTRSEESSLTIEGEKNTKTVVYAMDIEFDQENFDAKAPMIDISSSDEAIHLYHLFCHEVGHGLQMVHSKDINSVMYPTIPEKATRSVNYKSYFASARAFLNTR